MAEQVEFKEYTADEGSTNGVEHGASSIRAHEVTDDTAGEYVTPNGPVTVGKGNFLLETSRPGIFDVVSADAFNSTGYKPGGESEKLASGIDKESDRSEPNATAPRNVTTNRGGSRQQ